MKNNKTILKWQQRFKSEKHNVSTEEIIKIVLISNDDKRIQSIDTIEKIKFNNIISITKMINFDNIRKEDMKEHN